MRMVKAASAVLAVMLVVTVAVVLGPAGSSGVAEAAALQQFGGCEELLEYVRSNAEERSFTGGEARRAFGGGTDGAAVELEAAEAAIGDAPVASAAPGAQDAADFSGTNVQEEGVDEPDVVKTDGRTLFTVAGQRLQILSLADASPRLLSTRGLPQQAWGHELLLDGGRLLVVSRGFREDVPVPHAPADPGLPVPSGADIAVSSPGRVGSPVTTLALLDVTDPAAPQEVSTLTLDGDYVSARMTDGVARVVLRSQPQTPVALGASEAADLDAWLPGWSVTRVDGSITADRPLLGCDQVYRPAEAAGVSTVSVLTVDLGAGLTPESATAVVADAETVYASPDRLYVAVNRWQEAGASTEIHAFDTTGTGAARYVGSGRVEGRLLNQFAMSEHEGFLRVATTREGVAESESAVTVLAERGERLEAVGQVGGLGKTEQIHAVRFLGEHGFVVTFRQTDPLYSLDLSDPTAPRVLGELKINGYSAYLHPLGDGLLLGVGQDATPDGRTLGMQVSVFDVSDLASPQRLHQVTVPGSASAVEHDHRAFLHWPATGLAVVPLQRWDGNPLAGVHAYEVGRAGIVERARLSQPGIVHRSLVVGDALYTVSEAGVAAHDLQTLATRGFTSFTA